MKLRYRAAGSWQESDNFLLPSPNTHKRAARDIYESKQLIERLNTFNMGKSGSSNTNGPGSSYSSLATFTTTSSETFASFVSTPSLTNRNRSSRREI